MGKKKQKKILDECTKMTWIENYKFRLFVDLYEKGAEFRIIPKALQGKETQRAALKKKILRLNFKLKNIFNENLELLDELENSYGLKQDGVAKFRLRLLEICEEISHVKSKKNIGGRSVIKGYASSYLSDLLLVQSPAQYDLLWLKDFFSKEIESKKFVNVIFSKLPRNTSLPSICENRDDSRFWYKHLKKQAKTSLCELFTASKYESFLGIYLHLSDRKDKTKAEIRECIVFDLD